MAKEFGHTKTLFIQYGKYKWSYKFDHCIECGSCDFKHKGRGLCTSCFDKERKKKEKRKVNLKKQTIVHYFKKRILLFLRKKEFLKRGKKPTGFDIKKYKLNYYQKNKEVLALINQGKRLLKKGMNPLKININGKIRYLPFESLEKPNCTTNNMCLYDEWKEKMRKYKLLCNYWNKIK